MRQTASYDIAIIGGGASGLAAAITATRAGLRAVVLERDVEAGLSILKTGNGRCNLGNQQLDLKHYRNAAFVSSIFGTQPERAIDAFFDSLGLLRTVVDGRIYPASKKAESVRDVLLNACRRLGVDIICGARIEEASQDANGRWALGFCAPDQPLRAKAHDDQKAAIRSKRKALRDAPLAKGSLSAARVILASGGLGNEPAGLFGIAVSELRPVLCPITCAPSDDTPSLKELDGLRVDGALNLKRDGAVIWSEPGEVLFRPYGVSGIAVFNASRRINEGDTLVIDCLPQVSTAALAELLDMRARLFGAYDPADPHWFDGLIAPQLGHFIAQRVSPGEGALEHIGTLLKSLDLVVTGTADERVAQVHRGGIDVRALAPGSLACAPRNVFACGEALDVDADCGGYNLAWAWLSGVHAAKEAASGLT